VEDRRRKASGRRGHSLSVRSEIKDVAIFVPRTHGCRNLRSEGRNLMGTSAKVIGTASRRLTGDGLSTASSSVS